MAKESKTACLHPFCCCPLWWGVWTIGELMVFNAGLTLFAVIYLDITDLKIRILAVLRSLLVCTHFSSFCLKKPSIRIILLLQYILEFILSFMFMINYIVREDHEENNASFCVNVVERFRLQGVFGKDVEEQRI